MREHIDVEVEVFVDQPAANIGKANAVGVEECASVQLVWRERSEGIVVFPIKSVVVVPIEDRQRPASEVGPGLLNVDRVSPVAMTEPPGRLQSAWRDLIIVVEEEDVFAHREVDAGVPGMQGQPVFSMRTQRKLGRSAAIPSSRA